MAQRLTPVDTGDGDDDDLGGLDDLLAATAKSDKLTIYKTEEDVPAAFRDMGKPGGPPLTTEYVGPTGDGCYDLPGWYLSKHHGRPKAKLGKQALYEVKEIAALCARRSANT